MKMQIRIASAMMLGLALVSASRVQAADTWDMTKVTCEELMADPGDAYTVAVWFSGFYNGKLNNTTLDIGGFKAKADAVGTQCHKDPKATVMKVIEGLFAEKK